MKLAAIDVGSNSIHMIIAEIGSEGSYRIVDREKEMIGLGRGTLGDNYLGDEAVEAGLRTLAKLAKLIDRHGVDEVAAVATSAVREAVNGGDFLDRVRKETGIQLSVISGAEEARLIGLAVRDGVSLEQRRALAIDIGGGSVELIVIDRGRVLSAESAKLGVIRMTERFPGPHGKLEDAARRELEEYVKALVGPFVGHALKGGLDVVVGTSGTILTLGAIATGARSPGGETEQLNGRPVEAAALRALADRLAPMSARERARLPGIAEARADTIAAGAVILSAILELAQARELVLCDRAVREGILADYLDRNRSRLGRLAAAPNLRARSVLELAERYGFSPKHTEQVRRFALYLFDRTRALHGLGNEERELLDHAALLHDVGSHIAYEGHHRHGYYLIRNGGLRGFHPEEVEWIAALALYHRRRAPRKSDAVVQALGGAIGKLRVLAGILRIADALDRTHFQVVKNIRARVSGSGLTVTILSDEDAELEAWAATRKAALLEKAVGLPVRFLLRDGASAHALKV